MPTYSPPGEQHTAFMQWAIAEGVKENEVMVEVPRSAMLSIDSIPADFVNMFNGISTHGLLAAFLTHGDPKTLKRYDLWKATWPTLPDFEEGMPILWSKELGGSGLKTPISTIATTSHQHDLSPITLPPSVSGLWNTFHKKPLAEEYTTKHQNLLAQQEARLREAWRDVIAVFPDTDWEKFSYHWLIVNTRSFYYLMPGQDPPEDTNDAMAMVPFADYFNHTDDAECEVHFDGKSYTFRATRLYKKGEEIYMSYGPHPNDFLFVEYGFYLETNESDAIFLDDIIFKDFTVAEKEELIRQRYYGNYQITLESGPCFRTEVAASMKCMSRRNWRNYIQGCGAPPIPVKVNAIIRDWVDVYLKDATETMAKLEEMLSREKDSLAQRKIKMLIGRWEQIKQLCEAVSSKLD
uniref:Ribosomal N-lysine methyltransferase set11 n=1 Tax=Talaromyces marneffei PM1 TaxID=1077442 RepID=A0A093VS94_TALMA